MQFYSIQADILRAVLAFASGQARCRWRARPGALPDWHAHRRHHADAGSMSDAFSAAYARRTTPHTVRRLETAVDEAFERAVDRERTERYALTPTELAELLHAASRPQKAG